MLAISIDFLTTYILTIVMLALIGTSFFYDYWDGRYSSNECVQFLFYCIKCNNIYASKEEREYCECPKCKVKNFRLKF